MNKITDEVFKKILELREQGLFLKEICEIININVTSLHRFLKRNNLKLAPVKRIPHNTKLLTKEEKQKIVEMLNTTCYIKNISKQLNIDSRKISKFLNVEYSERFSIYKKQNRKQKKTYRKYTVDESYFDEINNFNKAYILGFLYADGYNSNKGIQIGLQKRDLEILEFINNELQSNCNIKETDDYVYLYINSRKLSLQLDKLGCYKNKTFKISFPYFLEKQYLKDFIRGYFDGDGSVYKQKNYDCRTVSFIGNNLFIEQLFDFLKKEFNTEKIYLRQIEKCNNKISEIRFTTKEVVNKFYNYIYPNDTCFGLKRKKDKLCQR